MRGINLGSINVTERDGRYLYNYDAGTYAAAISD